MAWLERRLALLLAWSLSFVTMVPAAAQQVTDRRLAALRERLATVSAAYRQYAEAYLAATDAVERLQNLSAVSSDTAGGDFVVAALQAEPSMYVRASAIQYSGFRPALVRHAGFRALLADWVRTATDSLVVMNAYRELRQLRARDDAALLAARVREAGTRGVVPAWLGRLHEIAIDGAYGITVPAFLRTAPPVFAAIPAAASVRVLAFGDWGVGDSAQMAVAARMRAFHAREPFTLGITLGDNFYGFPRPESPGSFRFQRDYESAYGALGIPIYVAVGNHDFDVPDQAIAEYAYGRVSATWRMPALNYTFTAGPAQFFAIDGNEMTTPQLAWLDSALAASRARWKVVYGHFPAYVGTPGGPETEYTRAMREQVVPLLRRHGVDLFVNGHHHSMQHWTVAGIDYVTSGGGGRTTYAVGDTTKADPRRRFAASLTGFAVFDIDASSLTIRLIASDGRLLHRYVRRKP
jgi:hypothetical protein